MKPLDAYDALDASALALGRRRAWRHPPARAVPLTPGMVETLLGMRGTRYGGPGAPLWATKRGKPLEAHNLRTRVLRPAVTALGMEWVGFHTFRHTCVSLLFAGGKDVKVVQTWLVTATRASRCARTSTSWTRVWAMQTFLMPTLAAAKAPGLPFFQAAATIIPILSLAMLFQAKTVQELDPYGGRSLLGPVVGVVYAAIAVGAEAETLGVLAGGSGTVSDKNKIAAALLYLVMFVLLGPFWAEVKRVHEYRAKHGLRDVAGLMYGGYFVVWFVIVWKVTGRIT